LIVSLHREQGRERRKFIEKKKRKRKKKKKKEKEKEKEIKP